MSEQRPAQPEGPFGGMRFPDPFAWWKQLYEANEETWAKSMEQAMGTSAFAEALGRYMQSYLELQDLTRKGVERYLETLNVPSRNDVARIAEQVIALESKIDDLDFKTDELVAQRGAGDGARRAALEARVGALDGKLDRILRLLEQTGAPAGTTADGARRPGRPRGTGTASRAASGPPARNQGAPATSEALSAAGPRRAPSRNRRAPAAAAPEGGAEA
jgi:polyhydroxyalkanoic acid synthase PhaR subunit